jgi:hypothetical protein
MAELELQNNKMMSRIEELETENKNAKEELRNSEIEQMRNSTELTEEDSTKEELKEGSHIEMDLQIFENKCRNSFF